MYLLAIYTTTFDNCPVHLNTTSCLFFDNGYQAAQLLQSFYNTLVHFDSAYSSELESFISLEQDMLT